MIYIYIGTETGTAEYVADELIEVLNEHSLDHQLVENNQLPSIEPDDIWLFCTSTHGAGEIPDNLKPIYEQLHTTALNGIKHLVIGLGDSSYDTYCYAAIRLNEALNKQGSNELSAPILADAMSDELPEDLIIPQFKGLLAEL